MKRTSRVDRAIDGYNKGIWTLEQAAYQTGLEKDLLEAELIVRGIYEPGSLDTSDQEWLDNLMVVADALNIPVLKKVVEEMRNEQAATSEVLNQVAATREENEREIYRVVRHRQRRVIRGKRSAAS